MDIYENIKAAATQAKISISNLETACGFAVGSIGKWKTSIPKVDNLYKVAQYLNKPLEYFLTGTCPSTDSKEHCSAQKPEEESSPEDGFSKVCHENGISDHERLIIEAFRSADAAGQQNIIFACQLELRKGKDYKDI